MGWVSDSFAALILLRRLNLSYFHRLFHCDLGLKDDSCIDENHWAIERWYFHSRLGAKTSSRVFTFERCWPETTSRRRCTYLLEKLLRRKWTKRITSWIKKNLTWNFVDVVCMVLDWNRMEMVGPDKPWFRKRWKPPRAHESFPQILPLCFTHASYCRSLMDSIPCW